MDETEWIRMDETEGVWINENGFLKKDGLLRGAWISGGGWDGEEGLG